MSRHPVFFAHGMESSPQGTKAVYLREAFGAVSPWLGELGLPGQVDALAAAIGDRGPTVLVGSSLGGLAALGLAVERPGLLTHLVLLAPAVGMERHAPDHPEAEQQRPGIFEQGRRFGALAIPGEVPATVIHGLGDEVIRTADVLALVERSPSARLLLVHDDHSLHGSGELIRAVVSRAARGIDPLPAEG